MRFLIILLSFIFNSYFCYAGGGDSLIAFHNLHVRHKHEDTPPLIEKMSDAQLLHLIDYMFEASSIPQDLWSEVMMETAKRNLIKSNQEQISNDIYKNLPETLFVEKILPDSIYPLSDAEGSHPASQYYSEWDEELTTVFKDDFNADSTYTLQLTSPGHENFVMPAWGPLSSPFGWRRRGLHKGTDIQLRKGDTVRVAFDGMVRFAQRKGGYGNVVIVRHYNGLETVYAHLSKIKVQEGQVVKAGELIGLSGSTGHSTGPHLHFETRFMGAPVNAQYFISFVYGNLLYDTIVFKKNKNGLLAAFRPDEEFHTVEKGETFTDIASHYGTTTLNLREMNGIAPKQYYHLKQGMVLRVRIIGHSESAAK